MEPFHVDRVRLENGVWTWDALDGVWFVLQAFFVMVLADLVGRAKAARLVGHHGKILPLSQPSSTDLIDADFLHCNPRPGHCGCHLCMMRGLTYADGQGTYHFPHVTPAALQHVREDVPYDVRAPNFPATRTTDLHAQHVEELAHAQQGANGAAAYAAARRATGVVEQTAWSGAAAWHMPGFFPIDIMHLLEANVKRLFWQIILGKLADNEFGDARWVLSAAAREQIEAELLDAG